MTVSITIAGICVLLQGGEKSMLLLETNSNIVGEDPNNYIDGLSYFIVGIIHLWHKMPVLVMG